MSGLGLGWDSLEFSGALVMPMLHVFIDGSGRDARAPSMRSSSIILLRLITQPARGPLGVQGDILFCW